MLLFAGEALAGLALWLGGGDNGLFVESTHAGVTFIDTGDEAAVPELAPYRLVEVFKGFGQFRDQLYVLLPAGR